MKYKKIERYEGKLYIKVERHIGRQIETNYFWTVIKKNVHNFTDKDIYLIITIVNIKYAKLLLSQ